VNIRNRFQARAHAPAAAGNSAANIRAARDLRPTVFLHGGWRCGSTYIWSRLRECADTLCFYEPFHETLSRCTRKRIWRDTALSWNSRHPPLSLPYRYEYLPLLRAIGLPGVRGYREAFALAEYFPSECGIDAQLAYVRQLVRRAQRSGTQPVLGFSRSLARAGAIKAALGGCHVVIRRNPVQQWLSCRSYRSAEGASYFELCHFLILALAAPHSPAGWYARFLGLPRPPAGRFLEQLCFVQRALWPWTDELSYRAFLGVRHLSHAAAMRAANIIIDIDRLSAEPAYRDQVSAAMLGQCGLAVRFDDCRVGSHDPAGVAVDFSAVESDVRALLRIFCTEVRARHERSPVLHPLETVDSRAGVHSSS
jgi:hypothetical protein